MHHFALLCFLLSLMQCAFSQNGKFSYQAEIGSLLSIGSNEYEIKTVTINNTPVSVSYASVLRFKHPSLRVRNSINYKVSKTFEAGIEAGVTVRYNEPAYSEDHLLSFPILSKFQLLILPLSTSYNIGCDLGIGYSFMNITRDGVKEKGGLIYHGALSLNMIPSKSINWKILLGFEQQHEKLHFKFNGPEAHIIGNRLRNQIFISLGFSVK